MSMSTFNEMMNNKDYHVVIDGNTPLGGVKFVSTSGDEIIVYPDGVDKKIEKIKESAVAKEEKEETIVAEEKEDTAMKKTIMKHNGLGRFLAKKAVAGAMKASYGAGFATGFVKESIRLASNKSKLVTSFKDGFRAGEEAARNKAENKAAKKAASELMEEFDWNENEQFGNCVDCNYPNCEECHLRNW